MVINNEMNKNCNHTWNHKLMMRIQKKWNNNGISIWKTHIFNMQNKIKKNIEMMTKNVKKNKKKENQTKNDKKNIEKN